MGRRNSVRLSDLSPELQKQVKAELGVTKKAPKRHKYNVSPKEERTVDGIVFASKWEARGYGLLKMLIGKDKFTLQPKYVLSEGFRDLETGKKIRDENYLGDFDVTDPTGAVHTLDFKGVETAMFRSKAKRFLKRYGRPVIRIKTKKDLTEFLDKVGLLPK
jgi:hypothetical protein